MKNILTAITVLSLILSGYLGYKLYTVTHPPVTQIQKNGPITPSAKPCPIRTDYSNADFEGIINYETATLLANNYKNDLWKANIWKQDKSPVAEFVDNPDARSVWFSLERLKNFIWHVEKQNCDSLGYNETLGMRIYFAKYPELNLTGGGWLGLDEVPKEYSNHHTLFMVPTYQNEKGNNVDFYPGICRASLDKAPLMQLKDSVENYGVQHAITQWIFLMGTGPDSQNHGSLIPPGSPSGTSFN
jgi:hypothetical protein